MKQEIYEDVLKEEPQDIGSKEYKKWEKKLHKSIGWIEPEEHYEVLLKETGKGELGYKLNSSPLNSTIHWDVQKGDGSGFTCERQEDAEIMSLLLQVNKRLKRIEAQLKNLSFKPKHNSRRIQSANPNTDVIINVQEANKVSRYNQNKKAREDD